MLLEILPERVERVLDLGTGDGYTLGLVLAARPGATGVGARLPGRDARPGARALRGDDRASRSRSTTSTSRCPAELGDFDVVVSSFAIHHLVPDAPARALRRGVRPARARAACSSTSSTLRRTTERCTRSSSPRSGSSPERRRSVEQARRRSRRIWPGWTACGFADVDCLWKWRELAVVAGTQPGRRHNPEPRREQSRVLRRP